MRKWLKDWEKLNPILADGEVGEIIGMLETKTGDGKTPWNELLYTGESDSVGTFGAVDIPYDNSVSSLVAEDVQTALDDLNAAQASHAANTLLHSSGQEVNYIKNDTEVTQPLMYYPTLIDLLTFSVPATVRPLLVKAEIHMDFDTMPSAGDNATINLFVANGGYTTDLDTDYVAFSVNPVYPASADNFMTLRCEGRLDPSGSARTLSAWVNKNTNGAFACHVMNGALVPKAFKSWLQATYL